MNWLRIALVLLVLSPAAARAEDELPLVGLDDAGAPIEMTVPKQEYTGRLSRLISATHMSALPALATLRPHQKWHVRTVVVGVALDLGGGIDKIWSINATPGFRLAFTNSSDPVLP